MLETFDTPTIFSCLSFNFGKQSRVLKAQSGYEGKESRRENRNQGTTWGSFAGFGYADMPLFRNTRILFIRKFLSQYGNFPHFFTIPISKLSWQKFLIPHHEMAKLFGNPISQSKNNWYPSKNSSTPVPSIKNDSSLNFIKTMNLNLWHCVALSKREDEI